MRVGLTYDLKPDYKKQGWEPQDADAEFDNPETVQIVSEAIEWAGYEAIRIGNAQRLIKFIHDNTTSKLDIVFNIAEGNHGRNRESQVPIILEMMDIPFVGADGLTLSLALDKIMTKKVLVYEGIRTPRFIEISDVENMDGLDLRFPLIVKPRYEGSSKGIDDNAVVNDEASLRDRARYAIDTYRQPALVEEFIRGKEFTVAIIGNDQPQAYPPVQVRIDGNLELGNLFYTFSRISSDNLTYVCPAPISNELDRKIRQTAVSAYRAVECKDFGRVDIRVDEDDNVFVLEINPLPSLATADAFMMIANATGTTFNHIINKILDEAITRYGIKKEKGLDN